MTKEARPTPTIEAGSPASDSTFASDRLTRMIDIVCAGGEGAEDFIESRRDAPLDGEPGLLARLGAYLRRVGAK